MTFTIIIYIMKKHKNIAKSACFYGVLILYLKYWVFLKIQYLLFFFEAPLEDVDAPYQGLNIQHLNGVLNAR